MRALLGVLCFHFPELLTGRDFRIAWTSSCTAAVARLADRVRRDKAAERAAGVLAADLESLQLTARVRQLDDRDQ
jgi:hypothetical protein